jgi:uncharacterized protein (TIGR02001 family)
MEPEVNLSKRTLHIAVITTLGALPLAALAEDAPAPDFSWTGHVDLFSKYVLRGATTTYGTAPLGNSGADAPESNRAALQWGADATWKSGFYLGYWASMINYSYKQLGKSYSDRSITDFQKDKSIENDLYGGYTGTAGDFTYTLGLTGYVYINGTHADALETKLGVAYGPFSLNAQTLLSDVVWGNQGDTYWTLNYTHSFPYDIAFNASLGYYTYKKEGKYLGTTDTLTNTPCAAGESFIDNGCFGGGTPESSAFRHLILGITQPIGKTGFSWGLSGIIAGKTRFGYDQDNKVIANLSYLF